MAERLLLLHPELIHIEKYVGIFILENMPIAKIDSRMIIRKTHFVSMENIWVDIKSNESQLIFLQESLNLNQGKAMFLNM